MPTLFSQVLAFYVALSAGIWFGGSALPAVASAPPAAAVFTIMIPQIQLPSHPDDMEPPHEDNDTDPVRCRLRDAVSTGE